MKNFYIIMMIFIAVMFIGWVKNIMKFADCDFIAPYKCEAIYGVGLIPAFGGFIGWMDIEDGPQ